MEVTVNVAIGVDVILTPVCWAIPRGGSQSQSGESQSDLNSDRSSTETELSREEKQEVEEWIYQNNTIEKKISENKTNPNLFILINGPFDNSINKKELYSIYTKYGQVNNIGVSEKDTTRFIYVNFKEPAFSFRVSIYFRWIINDSFISFNNIT